MSKLISKVSLFVIFIITFWACNKKSDVAPELINGKWILTQTNSNIEVKGSPVSSSDNDVRAQGIYFEFDNKGNYTTNAEISLVDNSIKKSDTTSTNTFKISGDNFILNYTDAQLSQELTLYLQIAKLNATEMELSIAREQLVKSFEESVAKLDPFTTALINLYLNQVLKFDLILNFEKTTN